MAHMRGLRILLVRSIQTIHKVIPQSGTKHV